MYLLCTQSIYFGDIETPKWFSLTRFSCFSPLWNSAAESLLCKAHVLGFWCLHMILKASAFGKIAYIQIVVKIIVISLLRCLKLLLPKFQHFPRRLSIVCFLSQVVTVKLICELGFFPLAWPANAPLLELALICRTCQFHLVSISSITRFLIMWSQGFQTPIEYLSHIIALVD